MSTNTQTAVPTEGTAASAALRHLYLARAAVAVVWAVVFAAVASSLDGPTITLLVAYPAIDVAASLYDARTQRTTGAATVQFLNAAISTAALVGLAIASAASSAAVLHVFGAWATVSGIVQLVVAVRRRSTLGWQWAMLLSGGLSTLAGVAFNVAAASDDPELGMLAGYAGLGGVLFLVSALLLRTRPASV
jgi:uncharacterized membrane protein HdeD (DUF308 family)